MKNVYLFQPSYATRFDDSVSYWLPYTIGSLWSYVSQNSIVQENFVLAEIVFRRIDIQTQINRMQEPAIAAFSCYVWNWNYNRIMAEAIKKEWPNCLIVFGGPQVPNDLVTTDFFNNHKYVDVVVQGEGERALLDILLKVHNNETVDKIVSLPRIEELTYPSPYTSGIFDKIIKENPNFEWQATLETNRGCPYQCTFCDWGSLTLSKVKKFPEERVLADIKWLSDNKINYSQCSDANFGIFYERDKMFAAYLNDLQTKTGFPKVVVATWAKNAKRQVLDVAQTFFANSKNRGFSISVQSLNDDVLEEIKRKNMEMSNISTMIAECNKLGIPSYTEMILGLPYETKDTWKENYNKALDAGQHNSIDVWFTELIENSELNHPSQREKHKLETVVVPGLYPGAFDEDTAIPETSHVVKSTRYMSSDDLIQSYLFSYIITNYHNVGKTQVISRFLRKHKNIKYVDFYTHLMTEIENGSSIMSREYHRIKDILTGLFKHDRIPKESYFNIQWLSIVSLYENKEEVSKELYRIFDNEYCQLPDDLYQDLVKLQNEYTYEYHDNSVYPKTIELDHNLHAYIFNDDNDLYKPAQIEITYPFSYNNYDNFIEKLYFGRRAGVLKNILRTIQNQ